MYLPIGQPTLLATCKTSTFANESDIGSVGKSKHVDEKRSNASFKVDDASQAPLDEIDAFVAVRCSKDRLLTLLVRELSIALWSISPPLQLSAHRRSRDSLEQHGHNVSAVWQPDSSYVAIQTSKDFVLIFFIDDSSNNTNQNADVLDLNDADSVYELHTNNASSTLQAVFDAQPTIFRRTLYLSAIVPVPQGVACLEALRTELFIATNEDVIRSMRWDQQALQQHIENGSSEDEDEYDSDTTVDRRSENPAFFYLSKVPVVVDALDASRNTFYHPSIQICDCEYSFLLGGFAVVLSDGSAAFLRTSPGADIFNAADPNKLCVQVPTIVTSSSSTGAVYTCTSVNHRFRLMAFGCRDSTCIVCSVDDGGGSVGPSGTASSTAAGNSGGGRIIVLHRLELPRKECDQEPSRMCGAVTRVAWTSDGSALVLTWERGGMSLWSTFGSLLLYQPRWSSLLPVNSREYNSLISVDWSADNYSLLLLSEKCFMKLSMLKAAWTANNVYSNRQYLLLHGDKQLLFNTGDRVVPIPELADDKTSEQQNGNQQNSGIIDDASRNNVVVKHKLFSNKLWLHLQPPEQYILPNMPLRCAAVSADGLYIACAGRTGFCYYSCAQRRWRMFGNVRQERSFFVTNALGWWHDNVVAGCYNWRGTGGGGSGGGKGAKSAHVVGSGMHEIRVYPRAENLDDAKAYVWPTPCTVLQLNVYDDLLTCFMSDGNVLLAKFIRATNSKAGAQQMGADAAVANGKSGGGFFYNPLRKRKSFTNILPTGANSAPPSSSLTAQREAVVQEIQLLQIIDINNIMPHPGCVLSVDLTPVRTEASIPAEFSGSSTNAAREVESLIINVCGKLIMIQREAPPGSVQPHPPYHHSTSSNSSTPIPASTASRSAPPQNNNFQLLLPGDNNPVLLASCVENFWINSSNSLHVRHSKPHLTEALWMHCGSHGLKVWLPLFPNPQERTHNFISKRIMLPTNLDIYPLAINFPDAIIHSAENEVHIPSPAATNAKRLSVSSMDSLSINNAVGRPQQQQQQNSLSDTSSLQSFGGVKTSVEGGARNSLPYFTIHRTTEVYLPHILRQLLRRNLGVHALDIAESCRALPYFDHTLELLLHHVLEEEAGPPSGGGGANLNGGLSLLAVTGNYQIPDAPLLPAVCAFVHEFDVFLDIIAHCSRKTDISLWPRLFAQVGHPADLFRECLRMGKLATAASFLVVMQAQMRPSEVRPLANALLQATRLAHDTNLESEMSRYLVVLELEEQAELAELLGASTTSVANGSNSSGGGRTKSPPLLSATPSIVSTTSVPAGVKVDPRQQQQRRSQQQEVSSFKYGPATPTTSVAPTFLHQQFRKLPSISHHSGATQMFSDAGAGTNGAVLTSSMSVIEARRKSSNTPASKHHQQLQRRITLAPSTASSRLQQHQQQIVLPAAVSSKVSTNSGPSAMNTPPGSIVSTVTGTSLFGNAAAPTSNVESSAVSDAKEDETTDRRRRSTKIRIRSGTVDSTTTNKNTIVIQRETEAGIAAVAAKARRAKPSSRTMSESNAAIDGIMEADDELRNLSPVSAAARNPAAAPSLFAESVAKQTVKNGYDPYVHLFPSFSDDVGFLLPTASGGALVADDGNCVGLGRSNSEAAMNYWLQNQQQVRSASPSQQQQPSSNSAAVGGSGGLMMMRSKTRALPGRARMFFGNSSSPTSTNVPSPATASASNAAVLLRNQQFQQQFER